VQGGRADTALQPEDLATATEFKAGTDTTKVLGVAETWAAAIHAILPTSGTITLDLATMLNAWCDIAGNVTLANPTNQKVGQSGYIVFKQNGGAKTLAVGSNWKFAGGSVPALSTANGAVDILYFQVFFAGNIYATLVKGVA